ncbi:hypothetical protein MCERE19_03135 [Spirosomataceae bacterium]|jgi:hypothetical protein
MTALSIQNNGNEMFIRIDRNGFDESYLVSLVKRLELEVKAKEAEVSSEISKIADKINTDWWNKNGEDFLKDVKKR